MSSSYYDIGTGTSFACTDLVQCLLLLTPSLLDSWPGPEPNLHFKKPWFLLLLLGFRPLKWRPNPNIRPESSRILPSDKVSLLSLFSKILRKSPIYTDLNPIWWFLSNIWECLKVGPQKLMGVSSRYLQGPRPICRPASTQCCGRRCHLLHLSEADSDKPPSSCQHLLLRGWFSISMCIFQGVL